MAKRNTIFISHDGTERALADVLKRNICQDFLIANSDVFVSATNLKGGQDWVDRIYEALDTCALMISVLSPRSYQEPWVPFEAGAVWRRAQIFPLCHSGMTFEAMKIPLRDFQGGRGESRETFESLYKAVADVFKKPAVPSSVAIDRIFSDFDAELRINTQTKLRRIVTQAGGVCVNLENGVQQYLLVSTTSKRRFNFPKGRLGPGMDAEAMAKQEIEDEAGVDGSRLRRVGGSEVVSYIHSDNATSAVEYFVFSAANRDFSKPSEPWRRPNWYSLADAEELLKQNRTKEQFSPLVNLLYEARKRISGL